MSRSQARWSETSIPKGVLDAATNDNVQVLALLACERFGNTLPISTKTTAKVVNVLVPSPKPAPISFLKGIIGFFPDDCATQLGNSAAGARFLGLAAALITTLGPFSAAKALDIMLRSSTADWTPTLRQLTDLLRSLEARSHRCRFADSVVGWQTLLRKEVLPCISEETRQNLDENSLRNLADAILKPAPSPEAIAGLVDVFCQVSGTSSVTGATIKVGAAAPWVLAFAQWCLETPPSLYVDKSAVLAPPESRVNVIIPSTADDISKPLEVTIHHELEDVPQPPGPASQGLTSGMVTVESYSTWLLQELGFQDGMLQLLREALEHAIPQVLSTMECGEFTHLGLVDNPGCRVSPLPDICTIAKKCATFLKEPVQFATLKGLLVADLPLVSCHLRSLMEKCRCEQCCRYTQPSSNRDCNKESFFRSLSFIIMDILALSLFDSPPLIRLSLSLDGRVPMASIAEVIKTGISHKFDDMELLEWARSMVGHVFDDQDRSLVMTYGRGQVVYPLVFDTFKIEKQGYLRLCSLPGTLRYQGDTYDVVSSPCSGIAEHNQHIPPDQTIYIQVFQPLNLFKYFKLSWNITIQDNKELHAVLMICSEEDSFAVEKDPLGILLSLRDTLLLESCPHDPHARLAKIDQFSSYTPPWHRHQKALNSTSLVDVIPVDSADDLRCFALACTEGPKVLRGSSCLACCLGVCRDVGVHVLIL